MAISVGPRAPCHDDLVQREVHRELAVGVVPQPETQRVDTQDLGQP
jgi:hypothetical protein